MFEKKELIVKKHSAIIQTKIKNLTLTQRKLINFLIFTAQKNGDQKTYKTTISEVKHICNIPSTENISVKEQLKDLAKITIEFNFLGKDKHNAWGISTLLASAIITPHLGSIEFAFSPLLQDRIIHPKMYAPINIILIAELKCSYAVILYEFLRDYLSSPAAPTMDIKEFKSLLGVNENEYKFFPDFRKKVLIPATEEVNLKTDLTCRYELIKETGIRNKYSHIRFFVTKKTGNLTYEKNRELKPERLDHNGNLFEKLEAENKLVLPEEILKEIPEKYRVKSLIDEIVNRIKEGKAIDYIGLNLRYAFKKAKENPLYYAINALNKNYAGFDIEIEAKKAKEKKAQSVAMKDNESQKKREEIALDIIRSFPPEKYDDLYEKAKELNAKEHPGNPFFIRNSMIEMRMAKLYMENSEINSYQNNDND